MPRKTFSITSFRENENNPKKIWSALKELSGKQSTRGVTYLEENETMQIQDDASIAEVFNNHFTGLAERLAGKTAAHFNTTTLRSFVSKRKTSDVKHAFPTITPNQTKRLIEAIQWGVQIYFRLIFSESGPNISCYQQGPSCVG